MLSGAYPLDANGSFRELIGAREGQDVGAALAMAGLEARDPDACPVGRVDGALRFRLSLAAALLRPAAWLWVVDAAAVPADLHLGTLAAGRSVLYLEPQAEPRVPLAGTRPAWGAASAPQP